MTAAASAPGGPEPEAGAWAYRPHLDGLRALAVYLVVVFHSGADRLSGGFIGVDVFFVLSGYLVTSLLLRDLGGGGRIRLGRFYARRMRRLLPAAGVNLVVTAIVFRAIAAPAEFAKATGAMRAAALYVSNWWFIRESTDYFGTDVARSPVAHYWSLSVEEQFYLAWPLLLGGLVLLARRAGRRERAVLVALVAALAAASLGWALQLAVHEPSRAYFGTGTRAYQLLAGALLALVPSIADRVRRRVGDERVLGVIAVALVGGLVVLATRYVSVGPVTRGAITAVLTAGLIVALESTTAGPARRALSLGPVAYLGRISYGTYLWHWIVILVAQREYELGPLATAAVAVPVATALAAVSYAALERPIRTAPALDRRRSLVIGTGLATSALVGLVVVPWVLDVDRAPKAGGEVTAEAVGSGRVPVTVDWQAAAKQEPDLLPCDLGKDDVCTLTKGSGPRVLLLGESHAGMLAPALVPVAERHDLTLAAAYLPYCPWERGLRYNLFGEDCFADQDAAYDRRIEAFDPDIVVLAHRPFDDPASPAGLVDADEGPLVLPQQIERVAEARTRATVAALRADGRKVVIVEPIPIAPDDFSPISCLSQATYEDECRFQGRVGTGWQEKVFRSLDEADDGVWSIDLDRLVCPDLPTCDPVLHGKVVMYDSNHLATGFAATLADGLEKALVDAGVLPD